jgi:hypothetical protein
MRVEVDGNGRRWALGSVCEWRGRVVATKTWRDVIRSIRKGPAKELDLAAQRLSQALGRPCPAPLTGDAETVIADLKVAAQGATGGPSAVVDYFLRECEVELRALITPPEIFHAVVWTERAAAANKTFAAPFRAWLERPLLWGETNAITHVVISPSGKGKWVVSPSRVLGLTTRAFDLAAASRDFDKYCHDTVVFGVRELHKAIGQRVPSVADLPLGVLCSPRAATLADNAISRTQEQQSKVVRWDTYRVGRDLFYGPSLVQLAEKLIIHAGVDPDRVLWIINANGEKENQSNPTLDYVLAKFAMDRNRDKRTCHPRCINLGQGIADSIRKNGETTIPAGALVELEGNADSLEEALAACRLTSPISLHYRAGALLDRRQTVESLSNHRCATRENLTDARVRLDRFAPATPWSQSSDREAAIREAVEQATVFDDRSGALCIDPYVWQLRIETLAHWSGRSARTRAAWSRCVKYFDERLHTPWQTDRRSYKRILLTPTKVLLRGEEYYANLKNEPPLSRLAEIIVSTGSALSQLCAIPRWRDHIEWRLTLALVDQIRNGALQLAWLAKGVGKLPFSEYKPASKAKRKALQREIARFLDGATRTYYAALGGREIDPHLLKRASENALQRSKALVSGLKEELETRWRDDRQDPHIEAAKLIRRWREADHPGENALVALHAWEYASARLSIDRDRVVAVGIGWGGIELPLAMRQVAFLSDGVKIPAFAAHYSKYAKAGVKRVPDLTGLDDPSAALPKDALIVLFDDNSLTGATLQAVAEHLVRESRATIVGAFLTRISGERRYDQMRMEEKDDRRGGMLNPELVSLVRDDMRLVRGQLGETPFSRAWSREKYQNPIGVFSLAKRRVLELLFSNSSADRFDREGF